MKQKIIAMLLCGALAASFGACSGDDAQDSSTSSQPATAGSSSTSETSEEPAAETEQNTVLKVGESGEVDGVSVTLVSANESQGSDIITPSEGNVYVLCNFTIQNNSEEDINISSALSFEAYCDDTSVSQDLMGLGLPEVQQIGQLDGAVAAGKNMNGVIVYEVPSGYSKLEVSVQPNILNDETVDFEITK